VSYPRKRGVPQAPPTLVQMDNGPVAYDEDLANRIRELLSGQRGLDEKRMFGGLAFLINGNMAIAASGQGGLLVRVPPDDTARLVDGKRVSPMVMSGRETRGWLRVSADGVKTKHQLQKWVSRGVDYATTLKPKQVSAIRR
jgi:hypothetical protein